jgi:hypothetical protein
MWKLTLGYDNRILFIQLEEPMPKNDSISSTIWFWEWFWDLHKSPTRDFEDFSSKITLFPQIDESQGSTKVEKLVQNT